MIISYAATWSRALVLILVLLGVAACSSPPRDTEEEELDLESYILDQEYDDLAHSSGSIYAASWRMDLFNDNRARQVGDVIVVMLSEETNASKQSSTSTGKSSDIGMSVPTILGQPLKFNDANPLSDSISTNTGFDGSGSSSQSNSLQGAISVTVKKVLPNGNLIVQGEKWLTINQGREFVKLRGVIRPSDIEPDNSITSWRVANAQISYGAKGALADANRPGWLTRFFQSIFMPF